MAKYRELSINSSIFALFVIAHQALSSPSTLHINLTWEYRVGFVLIVFSSLSMLEEMSRFIQARQSARNTPGVSGFLRRSISLFRQLKYWSLRPTTNAVGLP